MPERKGWRASDPKSDFPNIPFAIGGTQVPVGQVAAIPNMDELETLRVLFAAYFGDLRYSPLQNLQGESGCSAAAERYRSYARMERQRTAYEQANDLAVFLAIQEEDGYDRRFLDVALDLCHSHDEQTLFAGQTPVGFKCGRQAIALQIYYPNVPCQDNSARDAS